MSTSPRPAVAVRLPADVGPAVTLAACELQSGLAALGWRVDDAAERAVAAEHRPGDPECFTLTQRSDRSVLITASDSAGFACGLVELAEIVARSGTPADPFSAVNDIIGQPTLAWRSVQVFVGHALLDAPWYFDDDYWRWYLGLLALCRFNNLSLTFCHQTAYLAPPYPFHVPLPEFPQVRTPGFTVADRDRHLSQLQRISNMARQFGLHFTLGVWQQHDNGYGQPMIEGLDEDIRADCNALGLQRLLEACPAIDGLQLRMNYEAGVPEDRQAEYWQKQFNAIRGVGRAIRVDLRAKGLSDQTIALARDQLGQVVVSTKFWCEHLGMPYRMAAIQSFDVPYYRRYGAWDLLRQPRRDPLVFRLWTFGTQRILQWGSADYVRRFVESCREVAEGFEVMAPLTNKGSRNEPVDQPWRIIADEQIQPFRWEQQRYERFYRVFGRVGYDAVKGGDAVRQWMGRSVGRAGTALDRAFDAAGMILPLITTLMQYSASAWGFWPELFAGRSLAEDARIEPGDPLQFYSVETYVADALADRLDGRWSPLQSAQHLLALATATRGELAALEITGPVVRGAVLDLHIQADLAEFHAHRLTAMTHWHLFERTRCAARLERAITSMERAHAVWRSLVQRTTGVYHHQLTFGRTDFGQVGHWQDRLVHIERECVELRKLRQMVGSPGPADHTWPGEHSYPAVGAVDFSSPALVREGQSASLSLRLLDHGDASTVVCRYKPVLQTLPLRSIPMRRDGATFRVDIPARELDSQWDLMVLFAIRWADGSTALWPDWRVETPYRIVPIEPVSPGQRG